MGKKYIVIAMTIIVIVLFTTIAVYAANTFMSKDKAWDAFYRNKDSLSLTEEEFREAIKKRNPAEVLFASLMAKLYDKKIEEIYRMLEEKNGDHKAVSDQLMIENDPDLYQKIERAKNRKERTIDEIEKKTFTEEEIRRLKEEYDRKTGKISPEFSPTGEIEKKTFTEEEIRRLKEEYDRKTGKMSPEFSPADENKESNVEKNNRIRVSSVEEIEEYRDKLNKQLREKKAEEK
jgi:hypothetical protein